MCRGLTPRSVMHFEEANKWKLIGLAGWARAGDACRMENYDIRYAAPELLQADLQGVNPLTLLSHRGLPCRSFQACMYFMLS